MEKSRNNSRRLMAIIAVVLMVCLILAMGAVTFAKYISSGTTGDQTATAAKWGFVVTVDASDLLGENYSVQGSDTLATVVTADGVAVKANADSGNLVAPGTTGSMTFSIQGTAEVLAKITINVADGSTEIHVGDYYPVKWTLQKAGVAVENGTDKKLSEIVTLLNNESKEIEAGATTFETAVEYTLSWKWDLEVGSDATTKATNNAKDTLIGYKAASKTYAELSGISVGGNVLAGTGGIVTSETDYNNIVSTMSFNLTISVEQVQTTSD